MTLNVVTRADILKIAGQLEAGGFEIKTAGTGLWVSVKCEGSHAEVVEKLSTVLGDMSQFEVLQFGYGSWIVQPNIVPDGVDGNI